MWSRLIGGGRSDLSTQGALSADGGTFYVIGQFNMGNGETAVYALNTTDGSSRWPDAPGDPMGGGRSLHGTGDPATLTLDGAGRLWTVMQGAGKNNLTALDTTTGNIALSCPGVGANGIVNGVVVARDGLVVVFPADGFVVAVGR